MSHTVSLCASSVPCDLFHLLDQRVAPCSVSRLPSSAHSGSRVSTSVYFFCCKCRTSCYQMCVATPYKTRILDSRPCLFAYTLVRSCLFYLSSLTICLPILASSLRVSSRQSTPLHLRHKRTQSAPLGSESTGWQTHGPRPVTRIFLAL